MDEYGRERRQRKSMRWPFAIMGAFVGAMLAVLIAMAFRGPSTIIVQSDNDCCCCQQNRCVTPAAPKVGLAPTPLKKGYVPALPPSEGSIAQPDQADSPCCASGPAPRIGGTPLPIWPWWDGGGGGGRNGGGGTNPTPSSPPTPVPSPGTAVLIGSVLAAWRMTA